MKVEHRRGKPSPAMVVAIVALIVALGGTSYAAINLPKNSIGSKQLKKNAVTAKKIKKNAVNSAKVKNRSLLANDFKQGQLPSGAPGATGATGPAGPIEGTPAGGGLTGTYPNPGIAAGAVGPDQLAEAPATRATSSLTQTTGDLTNTIFTLNFADFNQAGLFSNAEDALIVPRAGVYVIVGAVGWTGNSVGQRQARILVNGVTRISQNGTPGNTGPIRQVVTLIDRLEVGDEVQLGGFQNSGGDLDTILGTGQGAVQLSGTWVGP